MGCTRGYGLKRWWRAERSAGESLKAFGRRYAAWREGEPATTFAVWFDRKGRR